MQGRVELTVIGMCLLLAMVGCTDSPENTPGGSTAGTGAGTGFGTAGTGSGSTAGSASSTAGVGSSVGTAGTGNQGGSAGTGEEFATAGTGNQSGTAGTGNQSGTAGTGNEGGAAGTGSSSACIDAVLALAGGYTQACAECTCGMCGTEREAVAADAKATAIVACYKENHCDGTCCFCGTKCPVGGCDQTYGTGPCTAVIDDAAIGMASMCYSTGMMVHDNCLSTSNNSCGISTKLGECVRANCATQCELPAVCN